MSIDEPAFCTVTIGLPTRKRLVFVPLGQATVGPNYLTVGYTRKLVKGTPEIDTDGELPVDDEPIFTHYELNGAVANSGQ